MLDGNSNQIAAPRTESQRTALGESEMVGVMYIRCVPGGAFVAPVTGDLLATWTSMRKSWMGGRDAIGLQRIHRSLYWSLCDKAVPRDGDKRGGEKGERVSHGRELTTATARVICQSLSPMSMVNTSMMNESRASGGAFGGGRLWHHVNSRTHSSCHP